MLDGVNPKRLATETGASPRPMTLSSRLMTEAWSVVGSTSAPEGNAARPTRSAGCSFWMNSRAAAAIRRVASGWKLKTSMAMM